MRRSAWFALLLPLLLHKPLAAQEFGDGLLVCYPNAPGNERSAQSVMERLGSYLAQGLERDCQPVFFNRVEPAKVWLSEHSPRFAILSQDLYLRWRDELGLTVVALSERGESVQDRFHLLVAGDSPWTSLADLQPEALGRKAVIWSSKLDDPRFATRVVFRGGLALDEDLERSQARVVRTNQPIRVLRRLKSGSDFRGEAVDAVLVDDSIWQGLQQLSSFQDGAVRALFSSPPLPTPPVVALRGVDEKSQARLRDVLVGMKRDPNAAELMETLQVTGFRSPEAASFAEAEEAYDAQQGEGS